MRYPIGGIFHVPHGLSNSLILPHLLRSELPHAVSHYAEPAGIAAPHASGSEEARPGIDCCDAADGKGQRDRGDAAVGGISERDLDRLDNDAMRQNRLLGNNPRELTHADARAIYAAAL